jgi:hypothetical protein
MSWRIEDHPDGGLQITHLAEPRFTARWTTGAFPIDQVREGAFFWTDEGQSAEDAVHLYGFEWVDPPPPTPDISGLLSKAIENIEVYIVS